jgi:hypothetical protein
VGRQNLAHPQIQQLGGGAVFESSDKILPWFCCFGTSSDGLLLRSREDLIPSVITSKAANGYHFKTGQTEGARNLDVLSCHTLFRQV